LAALDRIDEIALLCVPDEVHPSLDPANQKQIRNEVVNQCERLRDRMSICQVPKGKKLVQKISANPDTSYSALYYPWIRVSNPLNRKAILVPPGGHVAGIYARNDRQRGVHKAPANMEVRGVVVHNIYRTQRPLEIQIGKKEQSILNPRGVNVIRDFRTVGRGIRVWGARTMSSNPEWRFISSRRLMIFIEESINKGTQWVVFERNNASTWSKFRQAVRIVPL
jgi:phage tail sheath protein FI